MSVSVHGVDVYASALTFNTLHYATGTNIQSTMVQSVPDRIDFPKAEEEILEFWKEINAFEQSLKLAKGRPK